MSIVRAKRNPRLLGGGFGVKTLAMTYSRMLDAHYHRRMYVSLPSSEWDRVVQYSHSHQGEGGGSPIGPVIGRRSAIESGTDSAHALRGWEVANISDDSFVSLAKDASCEAT